MQADLCGMMMMMRPVTLAGRIVRLEPLSEAHAPALSVAGSDAEIWRFLPYGSLDTPGAMRRWILMLLERRAHGTDLPFAVYHLGDQHFIGATRYLSVDPANRSLEIGGTWFAPAYQGTLVNAESKLLLLEHAFERLGCIRVQLKSDVRNLHSQHAIEALGAVREGVFRQHLLLPDGTRRDSVYFSILDSEWPGVKARLLERLGEGDSPLRPLARAA